MLENTQKQLHAQEQLELLSDDITREIKALEAQGVQLCLNNDFNAVQAILDILNAAKDALRNSPEYTEHEKEMRVNEIGVGVILEATQQQLHDAQLEFTRITHNIDAVIANVAKAIVMLITGGAEK